MRQLPINTNWICPIEQLPLDILLICLLSFLQMKVALFPVHSSNIYIPQQIDAQRTVEYFSYKSLVYSSFRAIN